MDQVAALLGGRYGLTLQGLEPAPRGWTGETYAATAHDGARFFVKVYPKERLPPTAAAALPVLAELHRLGLTGLSRPIPSTSGALHEWLGDDLVVVFEYIDAVRRRTARRPDRAPPRADRAGHEPDRARDLRAALRRQALARPGARAPGAGVGRAATGTPAVPGRA